MERIEAYGNVFVSTPTDIVRGDRGTYHLDRGIATVTGNVKVTRGETPLNGDLGEGNFNTGNSPIHSSDGRGRDKGMCRQPSAGGAEGHGDTQQEDSTRQRQQD